MSARAAADGTSPQGHTLRAAVLAAAAFPRGDLPALEELVDLYAELLQTRSRELGHQVVLSGHRLLADPALACWVSQICFGTGGGDHPLPGEARSDPVRPLAKPTWDPRSWSTSLATIPADLCGALFPPDQRTPRLPHPPEVLRRELDAAMGMLHEVWPDEAAEIAMLVRVVLDGVAPSGRQTSGSSGSRPFMVAIEFEAGAWPGFLADALVHESSHIKMRIAGRLEPVVADDGAARYRHPWRPEPRPLEAVLVACHAFAAVHRFHLKCAQTREDEEARAECRRLRLHMSEALAELRGAWTLLAPLGKHIARCLFDEHERACQDSERLGLGGRDR